MTGALDAEMRDLAVELIDEYGKAITVVRESTSFDPATGETTTTTTDHLVNSAPPEDFAFSRIDGTLIQQGDTVVQVQAKSLTITPLDSDKIKIDGDNWNVVQVGKVYSGELVALFVVHLRR